MGLYGALIVRPAAVGQAYAYAGGRQRLHDEAVLVLSEIDPALNNSATPAAFDMRKFAPKYFLINGKAYPDTLRSTPRRATGAAALRQCRRVVPLDGRAGRAPDGDRPGRQPADLSIATRWQRRLAPARRWTRSSPSRRARVNGSKFAVYDGSLLLHNSNAAGTGGMLTFLNVGTVVAEQTQPARRPAGWRFRPTRPTACQC